MCSNPCHGSADTKSRSSIYLSSIHFHWNFPLGFILSYCARLCDGIFYILFFLLQEGGPILHSLPLTSIYSLAWLLVQNFNTRSFRLLYIWGDIMKHIDMQYVYALCRWYTHRHAHTRARALRSLWRMYVSACLRTRSCFHSSFCRKQGGEERRGEKWEEVCCSGRLNPSCRITV